jgi:Tfp pilus assembly protein PilZ
MRWRTGGRVLYSFNVRDYMSLHASYLAAVKEHAGLILAQQQRFSVGEQMRRLLRLVEMKPAETMLNTAEFLSSWG